MKPKLHCTLLAICTTNLLLLTACGGGGGRAGIVRYEEPPKPVTTPPPPPPRALTLPPAPPATAAPDAPALNAGAEDFLINLVGTGASASLSASTTGSLTKQGDGFLFLGGGRFDEGTRVEDGTVQLWGSLHSDVTIAPGATFEMGYRGMIVGDVDNDGVFEPTMDYYNYYDAEIFGNYSQSAEGLLRVALGLQNNTPAQPLLTVSGTATLDGGLRFEYSGFVPAAGYLEWVLHARGGVIGQFANWSTIGSPLFITGELRHEANDVYLLASRISTQAAMASAAAGDALTLQTAAHIDGAFDAGDRLAARPDATLSEGQRQFLRSAASIQNIRDYAQAITSFDSLSGHAHVQAHDVLHEQAATSASRLDARLGGLSPGMHAGAWSSALRNQGGAGGRYATDGQANGYDQWLTPHLLFGSSVSQSQGRMQLERMGGHGRGASPMASVYAHYRRGDWHATGLVGAGRTTLQLDRPVDLGPAGTHVAHSRRELDQTFAHGEFGRRVLLGNGRLTPFVAFDYSALRSDAFSEHGDTGFELVAQGARSSQWSAAAGARYARDWRFGGDGWLQLALDARYQRRLADGGEAQQAAFIGVPDAVFDLTAWSQPRDVAAMNVALTGGLGDRWLWSADYVRRFGIDAGKGGWFVGLRRDF